MSRFFNSNFDTLVPYVPGEQPRDKKYIKLNTNENPYPPAPSVKKAVGDVIDDLRLYSDPTCKELIDPLAAYFGVETNQLYVGNGSDEVLEFVFRAFCEDGAVFADLTYNFYKVFSDLNQTEMNIIPLRSNFTIGVEDYFDVGKTIFIANPNAPTSLAISLEDIEQILKNNANNLVVIDEAYVDFGCESAIKLINKYDNLLVVGTFSKSRSLSGARLGYAVGNAELIKDINTIKFSINPFNVNSMTLAAAAASVNDDAYFRSCCDKINKTRTITIRQMQGLGFECLDSVTNFVFARHDKIAGNDLYRELRKNGVLVRWFDHPRIADYLRITIGTDEEMSALISIMQKILDAQR